MSRLLCCLCARRADMGAALSHPQEGEACEGAGVPAAPPTMADVIRERKKKAGGAGLGTLRRRLAAAARRPRDARPDRGCEHARFIRSVVGSWRLAEVFLLGEELEAGAALRDLVTQAELAREPAAALHADLAAAYTDRCWCDVELVGAGWSVGAHRAVLAARSTYFRDLLQRYPSGSCRVPLEGAGGALSRAEVEASVWALYAGASPARNHPLCDLCHKWERGASADGELDIINVDNSGTCRGGGGVCACVEPAGLRRLGALLGFSLDTLHRDMRYLLDSGEYADARLVFRLEGGCGAQYGFRSALELPCHRVILAARSRFFRSVMSRRTSGAGGGGAGNTGGGGGGAVCVDEKVLPRRFARALLHAAYTDQVDLSLIGRATSSPSSTNTAANNTSWVGVSRGVSSGGGGSPRAAGPAMLDDAFQLYEIARFLEMPIVVQGCEDAIVEALSAETLPHVLRWASAPHASHWVHRQAMRYLRDEFPAIMSSSAGCRVPRAALAAALASPFLQASEAQALRALLRWAERAAHAAAPPDREPNVVWHTAHSVSRRGGRRREVSDAALREVVAPLAALIRTEHLPADHELLTQLVRRGIIPQPPPQLSEEGSAADAWLGRGSYRPPRCFLPYLDEIKALLEDQAVPEAEVARARRARYMHRIPDTLYMVAAARSGVGGGGGGGAECAAVGASESLCVSPRVLGALRARARELRGAHTAARALALHAADTSTVCRQIALRAVRELSLPDACADLLLREDTDDRPHSHTDRERGSGEWESVSGSGGGERGERGARDAWTDSDLTSDCCRSGVSVRCASTGSLRSHPSLHIPIEGGRGGTCRRDLARPADGALHRQVWDECGAGAAEGSRRGGGGAGGGALSACVPDVAMAPNANTHLLTARDYFRPAHPPHPHPALTHPALHHTTHSEYGVGGGVLQLDLGDGATHTPRPGSRAQRAAQSAGAGAGGGAGSGAGGGGPAGGRGLRDHAHLVQSAMSCVRTRLEEEELRAAIDLSVIRAYSVFHGGGAGGAASSNQMSGNMGAGGVGGRCRALGVANVSGTLPHCYRAPAHHHAASSSLVRTNSNTPTPGGAVRTRRTPSPAGGARGADSARAPLAVHTPARRVGSAEGRAGVSAAGAGSRSPSPSPAASPRRLRTHYQPYTQQHYRLEPTYGSSGSGSRGPSPTNYA